MPSPSREDTSSSPPGGRRVVCLFFPLLFQKGGGKKNPSNDHHHHFQKKIIKKSQAAPDGFEVDAVLINGQYPGPTIYANAGDRIIVQFINLLGTQSTIHWHGIKQASFFPLFSSSSLARFLPLSLARAVQPAFHSLPQLFSLSLSISLPLPHTLPKGFDGL